MIRHQDRIVIGNQRFQRIAQLRRPWRPVACQRNRSQPYYHFAHQRTTQAQARSGKASRRWRVRVHNAANFRPQTVNQQVHVDLTRHAPLARHARTFHVHHHHVRWRHPAFADAGGSHQDPVFAQPDGKIPIRGGHKAARVQQLSEFDNSKTVPPIARHKHTPDSSWYRRLPRGDNHLLFVKLSAYLSNSGCP